MPAPHAALPSDLLPAALRRDAAAPLITYYDDATGERIELSATTLANWVAKTANLLQNEFDIGPGGRVAVALPVHWQTAAVLLAVWSCGATVLDAAVEDEGALGDVDVLLVAQDRLEAFEDAVGPELLGLSLHPLGMGMTGYAGAARDFALEVRPQADTFVPFQPPVPTSAGLLLGEFQLTLAELVSTAGELATRLGIGAGDRILVDEQTAGESGPVAWLLAPLTAGASLVVCRNADPGQLAARVAQERITATLGCRVQGVRQLGAPAGA